MNDTVNTTIQHIVQALPKAKDPLMASFTAQLYASMPETELVDWNVEYAVNTAIQAFHFYKSSHPATPQIHFTIITRPHHHLTSERMGIHIINRDKPFLVDSLTATLYRLGLTIHETIHPIFYTQRNEKGMLTELSAHSKRGFDTESYILFEVSALPDTTSEADLKREILNTLAHVDAAVEDWRPIVSRAEALAEEINTLCAECPDAVLEEARDFMYWLTQGNFVFLGSEEKHFTDNDTIIVENQNLGISRIANIADNYQGNQEVIEISKSSESSLIHRPVLMDMVMVKKLDTEGNITGIVYFIGLFTSVVYYQNIDAIPFIRGKIQWVLQHSGLPNRGHNYKALKAILQFLPREEMLQMQASEMRDVGLGILAIENKLDVKLFVRLDNRERFANCLVFLPREHFSSELRQHIARKLEQAFAGHLVNFYTQLTDSPMARVHFIIGTTPGNVRTVDVTALENDIRHITLLWSDQLKAALLEKHNEHVAERLHRQYQSAFPAGYTETTGFSAILQDIAKIEEVRQNDTLAIDLGTNLNPDHTLNLKLYSPVEPIPLSEVLPILEDMDFYIISEHPFEIHPKGSEKSIWLHDFKLRLPKSGPFALKDIKVAFEEALHKVLDGTFDSDVFNALIVSAGLQWRHVLMLRAYATYLKQVGSSFSRSFIADTLHTHSAITRVLVSLFECRFNPSHTDSYDTVSLRLTDQLNKLLTNVENASEDQVIRRLIALIQATLRTNFYQPNEDGTLKSYLSFKFDSAQVPAIPQPIPYREIFVYSRQMEGVHLRGGKVARGGLRWSDRLEDFRTEILGLMKAQMVKNAVIVPVGSKGGFIVKKPPAEGGREAIQKNGIACYSLFLKGLLDITDNKQSNGISHPANVVCYDGEDPYLVVAADKGTATFSDIANDIAKEYGFWLGDAFASGGSAGYDHKKMGITARGAWVSVSRHFREMGLDVDHDDFSVAGIGDMSGDVFGNGMLLSRHIKLVAAFNHMHIFLDPHPDLETSFQERQRLFNLSRSTWEDYNPECISDGGGIFSRKAKTIDISSEMRKILDTDAESLTPDQLIQAILKAPVDLLWNGGIGTYVKAASEGHEDVGDRTNDRLRVDAEDLRCKVVGEGGNLGFTQLGRIEYALQGGRINTDAIDNSAGVDCSDHEVNIKIGLLNQESLSLEQRNALLIEMTEEVAQLVLRDNHLQTQAISIAEQQNVALLDAHARLIVMLEEDSLLNRTLEFLPSQKQLSERQASGRGLTRPEIAVLLSYAKLSLNDELINSSLPDDPYFKADLIRYFPEAMQKNHVRAITSHPLRREIISTFVTNSIVNRVGLTFVYDLMDDTGLSAKDIASAYTIVRDIFDLRNLWDQVEATMLDSGITVQTEMHLAINTLIEHCTRWLLRHSEHPQAIKPTMKRFAEKVQAMYTSLNIMDSRYTEALYQKDYAHYKEHNVPDSLALTIARLPMIASAFDIISISEQSPHTLEEIGKLYFSLGEILRLDHLREAAGTAKTAHYWDNAANKLLFHDYFDEQRRLTSFILAEGKGKTAEDKLVYWQKIKADDLAHYHRFMNHMELGSMNTSMLFVVLRHVKAL